MTAKAKIATLIKALSQEEIDRIIKEEEKYRREQAQQQEQDDADKQDEVEEEVIEIEQVALRDENDEDAES